MNIFRFINSKDIREHLRKLDYQFNSLETAWLIYQCREATIEEKHKAWEELIETMPDCEILKRFNTAPQPSLHDFLKKFMELEDRFVTQFLEDNHGDTYADDKPYVYQFEFLYPDGSKMEWHTPFSKVSEYKNLLDPQEPVKAIQCRKYRIDRVDYMMDYALFTPELKFLRIEPIRIKDKKENEISLICIFDIFLSVQAEDHGTSDLSSPISDNCHCYSHQSSFVRIWGISVVYNGLP